MPEQRKNKNQKDDVVSFHGMAEEIAEYLDEVSSGEILTDDETDGSIEHFPTAKTEKEIRGKDKIPTSCGVYFLSTSSRCDDTRLRSPVPSFSTKCLSMVILLSQNCS
jgi:hypothetical protein